MALGTPVIATDFGGSAEFIDATTGFPVAYEMTRTEKKIGPYEAGTVWANPDLADAVRALREVRSNPVEAKKRATKARRIIEERFSLTSVGERIKARLLSLRQGL
jgi:glycosyltransferase involved in cell wall biosynthesis